MITVVGFMSSYRPFIYYISIKQMLTYTLNSKPRECFAKIFWTCSPRFTANQIFVQDILELRISALKNPIQLKLHFYIVFFYLIDYLNDLEMHKKSFILCISIPGILLVPHLPVLIKRHNFQYMTLTNGGKICIKQL